MHNNIPIYENSLHIISGQYLTFLLVWWDVLPEDGWSRVKYAVDQNVKGMIQLGMYAVTLVL
jgi:hypothetical protein